MTSASEHLLFERDGRVAIVTFNRPDPRNAMTLEARVRELARHLAELAPLTLAAVKEATRRVTAPTALRDAEDIILSCYLSDDLKEGVRAFLDQRTPEWKGR